MKKFTFVFLFITIITFGCGKNPIAEDIAERAKLFVAKDLSTSPLQKNLSEWEIVVVDKLIKASEYMDLAFWEQVDPEGKIIFDSFANSSSPEIIAARHMMDVNYGRWDRFREFEIFVGKTAKPKGSYVYPADLTIEELNKYIAAHPDQEKALMSPFTVVKRSGANLEAIPYHVAYAKYVKPAAALIEEAAVISKNKSLSNYLYLLAKALLTDDYFEANMAWLDLDGNIDLSFGPHEVYDDQLTAQKAFYKGNVLIVDQNAAAQFSEYKSRIAELQKNLPVDGKFKPDQAGTMTPMILADDIRRAGQQRSIMTSVAFSLPNDPKVWEKKGSKKVMMGNYLSARRTIVLEPMAALVLEKSSADTLTADAYFTWVLMHEITHTLGPREVVRDGKALTVRAAMAKFYSPIEEGKADIGGLYNLPYLIEKKVVKGSLKSHYVGYLAESLRSIRFGMGSAYGIIRSAAWNFFIDEGALVYDSAIKKFMVDEDKMTLAVKKLINILITIEGTGDLDAAEKFINKYAPVRDELKNLLEQADKTVPLEFVPVYVKH